MISIQIEPDARIIAIHTITIAENNNSESMQQTSTWEKRTRNDFLVQS